MNTPENQEQIQYPEISSEVLEMAAQDQDMRVKNIEDPEHWDDSVDQENTRRMKEIVREIGWPTRSKVGSEASHMAWLLVQHADRDIEFQKECLELMKQGPESEVDQRNIAYLEDRIRVFEGRPQLYGTQFQEEAGELRVRPIEDVENIDERRHAMGLGTLEEGEQQMREKYPRKPKN